MARFAVIIAAAGASRRLQDANKRKKPFLDLKGRAIWIRSAELFVSRDDVVQTLIVIAPEDIDWFKEKFRANLAFMDVQIVPGGAERVDSVANALERVRDEVDFVAVHDAARPLLTKEWIDEVFRAAEQYGAVVPAVPVASTLKRVASDNTIQQTVSREGLWAAQTPQVFRRQWLIDAYGRRGDQTPTDDAQLVEQAGYSVKVIRGWAMNFKITTSADLAMAKAVVDALPKKTIRSLHPFADDRPDLF